MPDAPLVLITGASGLIGSRLADDLSRDHRVVGMDLAPPPPGWRGHDHIRCDLTHPGKVEEAFDAFRHRHGEDIASVVHLAAWYDFSGAESPLYQELTVEGTRRLVRALHAFHVEQLVFTSTLVVMAPAEGEAELLTEDSATRATWPYPRSKLEAEAVLREERADLPTVVLRLAGAYDEMGHSPPITQQVARIYEQQLESHVYPGPLDAGQPFIHLDDVVSCVRRVIALRAVLDPWEVFLISEPGMVSYAALQERIGELVHGHAWTTLRVPAPVARVGTWVEDQIAPEDRKPFIRPWMIDMAGDRYPVSIARARRRLQWEPRHRLIDVLPAMIDELKRDPIAFYEANHLPIPVSLREELAPGGS